LFARVPEDSAVVIERQHPGRLRAPADSGTSFRTSVRAGAAVAMASPDLHVREIRDSAW
jgi:hypothetical protein